MEQLAITEFFWIIAGLCVVATIYPYVIYPAILRVLPVRPLKTVRVYSEGGSEFALLFCAYNEASAITQKIANLRVLLTANPNLEIYAYDDCSSDGTADVLERSELGLRVIRGVERSGKAHGMKLLASMTGREYLVFTDANVELAPDALDHLRTAYSDPTVGGVCGLLQYLNTEGTAAAQAGGLYWRLEETIKSLESRSGNVMGADGSIFSIRKFLYPDFPDSVLDDMTVSMEVIFQGYRLIKSPLVLANERLVTSAKDDYRRRLRIATRVYHTHMLAIRPKLENLSAGDRWRWWSHRYLKWHGAFFIASGYLSALMAFGLSLGWEAAVLAIVMTIVVVVAGTHLRLGPVSALIHIASSIFLSGIGVMRARRGRTVTTWKPPATR
jgi:cellulose synthase/poly-beta-1,6-N-acetylglucosamine synthase-like glycosyltransferase